MVKSSDDKDPLEDSENIVIIPWYYNRFFKYAVGTLLVLTILFLFYQVAFFLKPISDFVSSLFLPIVFAFLFYYLLRPIIYFLEGFHIPRPVSIVFIYIVIALFIVLFFAYLGPILANQISAIANTSVAALEKVQGDSQIITIGPFTFDWGEEIGKRLVGILNEITVALSRNLVDLLGIITRVAAILVVIPFIVYYLLKEDHDISSKFLHSVREDFAREVRKILKNVDLTLSNYITGLVLISISVGTMLFIGYLFIGLKYALILSVIALIFTTIPFVGPFLAITPALLVGFSEGPMMALKVAVVFIVVQQIESNIVSPQIMSHRLNIHPLTIILLLLAAGTLYGLLGLILITPMYAVAKVVLDSFYKIYRLRYPQLKAKLSSPE